MTNDTNDKDLDVIAYSGEVWKEDGTTPLNPMPMPYESPTGDVVEDWDGDAGDERILNLAGGDNA